MRNADRETTDNGGWIEQVRVDSTPMNDELAVLEALESNQKANPNEGINAVRYSA